MSKLQIALALPILLLVASCSTEPVEPPEQNRLAEFEAEVLFAGSWSRDIENNGVFTMRFREDGAYTIEVIRADENFNEVGTWARLVDEDAGRYIRIEDSSCLFPGVYKYSIQDERFLRFELVSDHACSRGGVLPTESWKKILFGNKVEPLNPPTPQRFDWVPTN